MKDVKNAKIEIRLTPVEKEKIKDYAKQRDMTISEVVRDLCYEIFNKKEG